VCKAHLDGRERYRWPRTERAWIAKHLDYEVELPLGWLERYLARKRWGPSLRLRWREENGRKRIKYIGRVSG